MTTPYYQDGTVTLYHGDCLTVPEWLEADVLVTDPPYGRNWRQGRLKNRGGGYKSESAAATTGIANDSDTSVRDAALKKWGVVRPMIVFGDLMLAPPAGTKIVSAYAKPADAGLRGAIGGVRRDLEAVYLLGRWPSGIGGRSSLFRTAASNVGNPTGIVARSGGHPHAKPLDLLVQLLTMTPSGVIADPFAGSGSTLVAAKTLGRRAVGVEVEERYCELAARRLAQGVLDFGDAS